MEHGRSKNQPQAELIGVGVTPQTNGSLLYTALEHAAHGEKMNVQTRSCLSSCRVFHLLREGARMEGKEHGLIVTLTISFHETVSVDAGSPYSVAGALVSVTPRARSASGNRLNALSTELVSVIPQARSASGNRLNALSTELYGV